MLGCREDDDRTYLSQLDVYKVPSRYPVVGAPCDRYCNCHKIIELLMSKGFFWDGFVSDADLAVGCRLGSCGRPQTSSSFQCRPHDFDSLGQTGDGGTTEVALKLGKPQTKNQPVRGRKSMGLRVDVAIRLEAPAPGG